MSNPVFSDPFFIPDQQNSLNSRQANSKNNSQDDLREKTSLIYKTNEAVSEELMSPKESKDPQSPERVHKDLKGHVKKIKKQVQGACSLIFFDDLFNGQVPVEETKLHRKGKAKILKLKELEETMRARLQVILMRDKALQNDSWCCSGSDSTKLKEISRLFCFNIPSDLPLDLRELEDYIDDLNFLKKKHPDERIKFISQETIKTLKEIQDTIKSLKRTTKNFLITEIIMQHDILHRKPESDLDSSSESESESDFS